MDIKKTDRVLHISFTDEPHPRANALCGEFNKRQVSNKPYHPITVNESKLPFADKSFDAVICTCALQMVDDPITLVNEIRRISRKAHFKEYSEFAEMMFGWPSHKWIVTIEGNELVVKEKMPDKYDIFGPFFHKIYEEETFFRNTIHTNDWITKFAFDWSEEDDIVEYIEPNTKQKKLPPTISKDIDGDEIIDVFMDDNRDDIYSSVKVVTPVFKPTQTQYCETNKSTLGKIESFDDIVA